MFVNNIHRRGVWIQYGSPSHQSLCVRDRQTYRVTLKIMLQLLVGWRTDLLGFIITYKWPVCVCATQAYVSRVASGPERGEKKGTSKTYGAERAQREINL